MVGDARLLILLPLETRQVAPDNTVVLMLKLSDKHSWSICRPTYRPICQSTYQPTYRLTYLGRYIGRVSVDMSTDISVEYWSICRPTYQSSVSRYIDRYIGRGVHKIHMIHDNYTVFCHLAVKLDARLNIFSWQSSPTSCLTKVSGFGIHTNPGGCHTSKPALFPVTLTPFLLASKPT